MPDGRRKIVVRGAWLVIRIAQYKRRGEKALEKILQEKVKVIGSGRTDAGYALAQAANFKTNSG